MTRREAHITLLELNGLIRQSIQHCLPDSLWIQAETSDVRIASNGHCYLEFVQKDTQTHSLLAKAKGIIWANSFRQIRSVFEEETGQLFTSGLKVLIKVRVDFNELYGYSLVVEDIDPTYTLGDMAQRRKEILRRLEEEGVSTMNKELPFPDFPQRIAVISSPTAAGYGDFADQLRRNDTGIVFYTRLFPAIMQGERVEQSIIAALDRIFATAEQWDVVVIIRGGGATSDLTGFDTYPLAASVAQFPLPVITGIGHERDDTVLDFVANVRAKTPTAAAEFLIHRMTDVATHLQSLISRLSVLPTSIIGKEKQKMTEWAERLPDMAHRYITEKHHKLAWQEKQLTLLWAARKIHEEYKLDVLPRLAQQAESKIVREQHRIELLSHRAEALSPERILRKGYSITLKDEKVVRHSTQINAGDTLRTILAKGSIESTVIAISKEKANDEE